MFDFKRCESGETHRILACVNVARFTVKGDQGDETTAGIHITHFKSTFSSREAACG